MREPASTGVEEHAVGCLVVAAFGPPHDVMAVPSRQGGDLLAADRTESPVVAACLIRRPDGSAR